MRRIRSLAALGLLVALIAPALAQQAGPTRVIREHFDVTVAPDGSSTSTIELAVSPQSPAGVQSAGQVHLAYQEGRNDVEVLEAYTLKPDGRRIEVTPDRILTQVPPAVAQAPAFSDGKMKVLLFPDVAVGDQVVYRVRQTEREARFPGFFSNVFFYPRAVIYDDVSIVLRLPPKMTLNVDSRDLVEQPAQRDKDHLVREWRFRNATLVPDVPGAVDVFDRDPRLVVTSMKNWGDLARAYESRAAAKTAVTQEIRRQAREIVGDRKTAREKTQAIYEWVSANVRYVALYLGAGGYVPHPAEEVLHNRYGDCKDYTALLAALLAAEGIDSTPALVNAGPRYSLPAVAAPEWFNHVILWVPSVGTYLDATARVLPFGVIGDATIDKPTILTRGFGDVTRTPMSTAEANTMRSEAHLKVGEDGTTQGEASVTASGQIGAALRNLLQNAPPAFEPQLIARGLGAEEMSGRGTLTRVVPADLTTDPRMTVSFEVGHWLNLPGAGAFRLPSGLFALLSARAMAMGALSAPPAAVNRTCLPIRLEEKLSVELPPSIEPRVPMDASVSNRVVRYESHYAKEGHTLTVSRTIWTHYEHASCPPEDAAAFREAAETIRRDTQAQVLY